MPPITRQQLIWGASAIGALLLIILLWMFAGSIRDTVKAWQRASANQEINDAKAEAAASKVESDNAKQLAADTIKDLSETKDQLAKQVEITKTLETKLFDSNKQSEASKADYEAYKNKVLSSEYHSTNSNLNTNELCQRAKSLGISCE